MLADPYSTNVLKPEVHDRLVADLESYARDAGIPPHWIYQPLLPEIGEAERAYLRAFRKHVAQPGICSGMVYYGQQVQDHIEDRLASLAGALTRNFIRARVMTLGTVIDHLATKSMPELTCLLIPNFFYAQKEGGQIAPWQVSALLDHLTERHVLGLQTVLYVSDKNLLSAEYGIGFRHLLSNHYRPIGG